ncbi:MAG: hypothetical protein KGI54_05070 [Pseudomonadota bacterium]|nr:hypothetical protein [Pseudomonadota bacterium]
MISTSWTAWWSQVVWQGRSLMLPPMLINAVLLFLSVFHINMAKKSDMAQESCTYILFKLIFTQDLLEHVEGWTNACGDTCLPPKNMSEFKSGIESWMRKYCKTT